MYTRVAVVNQSGKP